MNFVHRVVDIFFLLLVKFQFLEAGLPPYIKACSASDPNFHQCCIQHANDAMPHIIKGDKKFGIPNLLPLVVPTVVIDAGKNLQVSFQDVHVYGLDGIDVKDVVINVNKKHVYIELEAPKLEFIGKYEINGKILILPIKGKGDMNITAIQGQYKYDFNYKLDTVNGEQYIMMTDGDQLKFELQDCHLNLQNLFNGDEKLGTQMNKFINENWKDVLNELGGAISETVKAIARSIASGYFKKVPYNQIILA